MVQHTASGSQNKTAPVNAASGAFPKLYRRGRKPTVAAALRTVENVLTEDELHTLAAQLKALAEPPPVSDEERRLAAMFTQGRVYTQAENIAAATENLMRSFAHRRELLAGALTASEVAQMLGTSRQTPHDRVKAKTLLAVPDNGMLRFPLWQFDPKGPNGVIAGLPETLRALNRPSYSQASWLTRPQLELQGQTPIQTLKRGKIKRVVRLAETVGVW